MNSLNLNLFTSTSAKFKLGITVMFVKKNPTTGKEWDAVKVSQSGYATADPSLFLTFSYSTGVFGDKDITVYTSYPHLLRIRTIFEDMKNAIMNNVAFISDRGLTVNDQYAEPRTIANIGEECPYCYTSDGFKVIGEVAPFADKDEDDDDNGEKNDDQRRIFLILLMQYHFLKK